MSSRGLKILQLLKKTNYVEPVSVGICAKKSDELCSDVKLKNVIGQSEVLTKRNDLELLHDSDSIKTYAVLSPISVEDYQLPSTSGINNNTADLSKGIFEESCDESIQYSSGDEFQSDTIEESSSSSSDNEAADKENSPAQVIPCHTTSNLQTTTNIASKNKLKEFQIKEKISKKRVKNESMWKKRKQAIARERGESYISYKGKTMAARQTVSIDLCGETCRLKCNTKFSQEDKTRILAEFYSLDVNAKNALLFRSIRTLQVGRKRKNAKTHKSVTYKYGITLSNEEKIVCKTAFCKLHQISRGKLEVIKQKLKCGSSAPSQDMRGRHSNRPHKLHEHVVEAIVEHIKKFPSETSHYSRNSNPHKMYLSPTLNMSIMYRLYLEECQAEKRTGEFLVKKSSYASIFMTKFNLSFMKPKSDTCSTCDAGKGNEEHKENASAAFHYQKQDREMARNNTQYCYITIDLQQTMPLPKLTTSKAFYLRQLWFYNFGIHLVAAGIEKSFMQTWTEDIAGRGSSEISSCFFNFVSTCQEVTNKQHLIIWSDSCAGQNKNFNMVCMYQLIILKGLFKSIDHKFPEVGHSYLDSDRDFGRIEKVLRRHEKIFTPQQYRDIIKNALKKNSQVNDMQHHFKDVETLSNQLGLMHKKKNTLNETVPFRAIKWLRVEEFGAYLYKETYDEHTPFKKVCLLKNTKSRSNPKHELKRMGYESKVGNISEKKISNLRLQLPYIDEEYLWFYEDLLARYDQTAQQTSNKKRRTK